MCGIAGWFNAPINTFHLEAMLRSLHHRGPECTGSYVDESVSLGNARLAFVDLRSGPQPLPNEDGNLWITCNGEIFNHNLLRQKLIQKGHLFRTLCDTEVILHLYEEYGTQSFEQLNGQYAFAIWDKRHRKLTICRDRLGICPLFFTFVDNAVYFASEIKALLAIPSVRPEIDPFTLHTVWTLWTPLPGRTLFKRIYELLPAHYAVFEPEMRSYDSQRYWQLSFAEGDWSIDTASEALTELLDDAVKIRLQADVPVGAYLSGGVDSSVISAFAKKHVAELHTFSVAFSNATYDESEHQNTVAQHIGTQHHLARYEADDLAAALPNMVWHTEIPQLRAGPIPMLLLSQNVHQSGIKAVLTGEGGDEFFLGYDIFKETAVRRFMARNPSSVLRRALIRRLYSYLPDRDRLRGLDVMLQNGLDRSSDRFFSHLVRWENTSRLQAYFLPEVRREFVPFEIEAELEHILPKDWDKWHWSAKAQTIEIFTLLTPYLLSSQGDRVTMANSVEGRFPFLDHRLIDTVNSFPLSFKLRNLQQDKYILRRLAESCLPSQIARRPKFPYRAPIQDIVKAVTSSYINDLLSTTALHEVGLFAVNPAQRLLKKAIESNTISEMEQMALTGIITTQLWYLMFIKGQHYSYGSGAAK